MPTLDGIFTYILTQVNEQAHQGVNQTLYTDSFSFFSIVIACIHQLLLFLFTILFCFPLLLLILQQWCSNEGLGVSAVSTLYTILIYLIAVLALLRILPFVAVGTL